MATFSQIVDEILLETVRPDLLTSCVSWLNQTIREAHTGQNGRRYYFDVNRREDILSVPNDGLTQYNWDIPEVQNFQASEQYWFPAVGAYAREVPPSVQTFGSNDSFQYRHRWYRSGDVICFTGYGPQGSQILASGFWYPRSLVYQPLDTRLVIWSDESQQFLYNMPKILELGITTEEALLRSTNWICDRWTDYAREGLRAKVYKRLADNPRAGLSYSAWQEIRLALQQQESQTAVQSTNLR